MIVAVAFIAGAISALGALLFWAWRAIEKGTRRWL